MDEKEIAMSNYKIYTFLDTKSQKNAIKSLKNNTKALKFQSFCSIILDNKTLGVKAYVTNLQSQTKRQPGSILKPILCYGPAFEQGILSPLTPIDDSPISYENWNPKNANNTYDGYISTREALYKSKNIPAIKALSYVGIENAKQYAQKMNIIFDKSDNHLALALGAMKDGVTPILLSSCYACFANDGNFETPHFIRKIEDYSGKIIYEVKHNKTRIFSAETAYMISDVLKDCAKIGTAKALSDLNINLAAKTGTVGNSEGNSDAWCVSYNKNLTILSWVGNTTGKIENNLNNAQNGGTITTQICKNLWSLNKQYDKWFSLPNGVKYANIDALDYHDKHILNLAQPNTPQNFVITDIFNEKYIPTHHSFNFIGEIKIPNETEKRPEFIWSFYKLYFDDFITV